jgi:hypothetical protein
MDARLKAQVRRRARFRCEYCQFPERFAELPFQVDHIIARQHGGPSKAANLALACFRCNSHKGPNLSGFDPDSREAVRLFHPRQDVWAEHFEWDGPVLTARTSVGRATIAVLRINRSDAVLTRAAFMEEGISFLPPPSQMRR